MDLALKKIIPPMEESFKKTVSVVCNPLCNVIINIPTNRVRS